MNYLTWMKEFGPVSPMLLESYWGFCSSMSTEEAQRLGGSAEALSHNSCEFLYGVNKFTRTSRHGVDK